MRAREATLIKRYAAVRKLRPRLLKRRWDALPCRARAELAGEMAKVIARYDAEQAQRADAAAFDRVT